MLRALDALNCQSRLANQLGRSSRGNNANILSNQAFGKIQQASLVVDGKDSFWW